MNLSPGYQSHQLSALQLFAPSHQHQPLPQETSTHHSVNVPQ